jgi:hypothetical protein
MKVWRGGIKADVSLGVDGVLSFYPIFFIFSKLWDKRKNSCNLLLKHHCSLEGR